MAAVDQGLGGLAGLSNQLRLATTPFVDAHARVINEPRHTVAKEYDAIADGIAQSAANRLVPRAHASTADHAVDTAVNASIDKAAMDLLISEARRQALAHFTAVVEGGGDIAAANADPMASSLSSTSSSTSSSNSSMSASSSSISSSSSAPSASTMSSTSRTADSRRDLETAALVSSLHRLGQRDPLDPAILKDLGARQRGTLKDRTNAVRRSWFLDAGHTETEAERFIADSEEDRSAKARAKRAVLAAFPIVAWLPAYTMQLAVSDLVAGLTTGMLLVPQSIGYAILADLPAQAGLYSSIFPLVAYALLGSSRQLAVGPVAIASLLTASTVSAIEPDATSGRYYRLATMMALMSGVLQAVMGVVRLGFVVDFLAHPVITGFTSAAAGIIGFSQVKHMLGVKVARYHYFAETIYHTFKEIPNTNVAALVSALITIAILVGIKRLKAVERFKKWSKFIPGALVVVSLGIVLSYALGDRVSMPVVGEIPSGIPAPSLPHVSAEEFTRLLPGVAVITIVGFLESISVSKYFATENNYEVIANTELVALGAANIVSSLFSGYPVTGGFGRSAVNAGAGAKTPLASLYTGALVLLAVFLLTNVIYHLPLSVLGALIIVAVSGLIKVSTAVHLYKVSKRDFLLWLTAAVATLAVGVELGIGLAIGVSLLLVIHRAARPHSALLGRIPGTGGTYRNVLRFPLVSVPRHTAIVRFDAPLFFANSAHFAETCLRVVRLLPEATALVLDLSGVASLDISAVHSIESLSKTLKSRHITLHLSGCVGPVRDFLNNAHTVPTAIPAAHVHTDVETAVAQVQREEEEEHAHGSEMTVLEIKGLAPLEAAFVEV